MQSYTFVPGTVAATTATAPPADCPRFVKLASVVQQVGASGGTASTTSPSTLTIKTSATGLGAGDIYWDADSQEFQVGTALTDGAVLTFHGWEYGELGQVS